jgi:hypothetical protein
MKNVSGITSLSIRRAAVTEKLSLYLPDAWSVRRHSGSTVMVMPNGEFNRSKILYLTSAMRPLPHSIASTEGGHFVDVEIIGESANREPQTIDDAVAKRSFIADIEISAGCAENSDREALDLQLALVANVRTLTKAENMLGVELRF